SSGLEEGAGRHAGVRVASGRPASVLAPPARESSPARLPHEPAPLRASRADPTPPARHEIAGMPFTQRHLLGLEGVPADEIVHVLDTAKSFVEISERDIKKVPTLRGKTVINLFYEASTRTRTSFEIAAKRLSADTINITGSTSSAQKGETLADTA